MNVKQAHYWQAQEQRWYEQYLEAEKMIDHLETINYESKLSLHEALIELGEPDPSLVVIQGIIVSILMLMEKKNDASA